MPDDATHREYSLFVDAKRYETTKTSMTGAEIKHLADVPAAYQLYLEEEGDKPDLAIGNDEHVNLSGEPKHFFAVPAAVFGSK